MHIHWNLKKFEELRPHELYDALQLRSEVFVVEQNCVFLDPDGKDQCSWHLLGYADNRLVAYTRLVPPGAVYAQVSIGRVVTSPSFRKFGAGKELMHQSIEAVYKIFGKQPIKIGAQLYLKDFYQSFGFEQKSDVYLEDGIEHIYMIKN